MSINKTWHKNHKMPENPTLKQKIKWHQEHQKHCSCWPVPKKLMAEIKKN